MPEVRTSSIPVLHIGCKSYVFEETQLLSGKSGFEVKEPGEYDSEILLSKSDLEIIADFISLRIEEITPKKKGQNDANE